MRTSILALAAALLVLTLLAAGIAELRRPSPRELVPTLTQQPEYCVTCHAELPQISAAHPVKTFGCVICHGGERLALDADLAHSSMRGGANPSDYSVVQQSCGGGECHSGSAKDSRDHIQRAMTSVQATYAGAITSILYTFGGQPDLTARYGTAAVSDPNITTSTGVPALALFDPAAFSSPFVQRFGSNCLSCHINAPPAEGTPYARLTGCAACHSPAGHETPAGETHILTTAMPYTQCNTCHNRGNYDLRTMTFVPRMDHPTDRLHDYYQPIAQFVRCEYTLDCVDCHTRTEAMGDGDLHSNKKEIQYVQCRTCHGTLTELPRTLKLTDANDIAFRLAQLNPVVSLQTGDTVLVTERGEPMWNTRVGADGTYELVGKASGEVFKFRPVMGSGCQQKPDEQASRYCHECHAVER
ncbi:MAG TPA: hypothetical protein VFH29_06855 [Anaerolineales bacterium]|nr:hypothetical protein [Anaerolineales bacterium]